MLLIITLIIMGILFVCITAGASKGLIIVFFLLLFFGGIFVVMFANAKSKYESQQVATYDKENGILNLNIRGPVVQNIVSMREAKNISTKDTPVKVHVGSATVGGVTTGGVYTTGGQTVITGSYSTGKWELCYIEKEIGAGTLGTDKKIYYPIEKISLTSRLLELAQKSNICKYLSGNYIQVITPMSISPTELSHVMDNLTSSYAQDMAKRGYPTQEKCQEILHWLTTTS